MIYKYLIYIQLQICCDMLKARLVNVHLNSQSQEALSGKQIKSVTVTFESRKSLSQSSPWLYMILQRDHVKPTGLSGFCCPKECLHTTWSPGDFSQMSLCILPPPDSGSLPSSMGKYHLGVWIWVETGKWLFVFLLADNPWVYTS